ncbi:SDR family oxidoreductase [Pseudomonas sp. Z1-29]|uniref:UDP-glucose 4-epimerase family protein n=1 Tax=Pseudomonas sp. Z1-29 TaxID=2817410 RepID=UPI003DA84D28
MSVSKILVTGANGFIGKALVSRLLADRQYAVIGATRDKTPANAQCQFERLDLTDPDVLPSLRDVQVIVHAAARVHVMNDVAVDALAEYRKANVEGTLRLAKLAAASGVKRFIFISSIKVNGERTGPGRPFRADDTPAPVDAYGISKREAEDGLMKVSRDTGIEIVIIRPPLVYGPGVKANFLNMMRWLSRGVPLPLGGLNNRRSLVALDNLVDLVITCIAHPAAANQIFLVSDGEDLSTTQLLLRMAEALEVRVYLLPLPETALRLAASLLGKKAMADRLCASLQVDIEKTCSLLGWSPPVSVDEALELVANRPS